MQSWTGVVMDATRTQTLDALAAHAIRGRRRAVIASSVAAALATVVVTIGLQTHPAAASGEAISGRLVDNTRKEPRPVVGVQVLVRKAGKPVGQVRTDANGQFTIPVPGKGTYEVRLDLATIPKGFTLQDPSRAVLPDVSVQAGQQSFVVFPFGKGGPSGPSAVDRFVDLLGSGVRFGLIIALAAVGVSLIFGTTGLVNFAQGELVTFGAIAAWYLNAGGGGGPGVTLVVAGVLAVLLGGVLGAVLELGLWRPLRHRRTGTVALLVVSIGLSLLLRNLYLLIFEGNPRSYVQYSAQRSWRIWDLDILPKDIVSIVVSGTMLVAVALLLVRTRLGTAVRAVTDNPELSESSGIDVQRVVLSVWIVSGMLAALAGVLLGTTQEVTWDMGFRILLVTFAAVIVGGLGKPFGAMAGGLLIGIVSDVSTFWIATDFKTAIALGVLIVVLLLRPQGILGTRERVA
jgi:neutral amino acid transport system permease protein